MKVKPLAVKGINYKRGGRDFKSKGLTLKTKIAIGVVR